MNLSFRSAKVLRSRVDLLPKGPRWKGKRWKPITPAKNKLHVFYRDPIECLQSLISNPLAKDFLRLSPFHLFKGAQNMMRVYTEWLSGDAAWSMQVCKIVAYYYESF